MDWSALPVFVRAEGRGLNRLSVRDLRAGVKAGEVSRGEFLLVPTFPHHTLRSITVGQALDAAAEGLHGIERLTYAKAPEVEARRAAPPAGKAVRSPTPVQVAPAPIDDHPPETVNGPPPERRNAWSWRKLLNGKVWVRAAVAYYLLGTGFWFFITANPELTFAGVGWGLMGAALKSAAVLVGVCLWVASLIGRSSSDFFIGLIAGLTALGLLAGATGGYRGGYAHLQVNQLAPMSGLVQRCMDEGIRSSGRRVGAVCEDGRQSRSTGRGTCSHHGGVSDWKYEPGEQTRTLAECQVEARRIQW